MFFIINIPAAIINFFDPKVSHREVTAGVCLAMFLGFVPWNGVMAVLLFLLFFVVRVNRIASVFSLPLFKLAYLLGIYKLTDQIGGFLLIDADYLAGFWRWFVGLPIIALLDISNTLVAGGLALSLILLLPIYFLAKLLSMKFRPAIGAKIFDSKFGKWARRIQKIDKVSARVDKIVS